MIETGWFSMIGTTQNVNNNINGVGRVARTDVYTLDNSGGLLAIQEELTRKIVRELNGFDNLYYEICNEPYFGGVTMDWQHRIIDTIVATESKLPNRHLISLNVANGSQKVKNPHPAVSVFNFHYSSPPRAVAENHNLNKVIGDNETGFKGTSDRHYHKEAWQFILAGGGLFNNLDYSFAVGFEDGSFRYPKSQPGGGSRGFRRQMKVLKDFMYGFNFIRMHPDNNVIRNGLEKQTEAYVLAEPGRQYAAHIYGGEQVNLRFDLPKGRYDITWVNTLTGNVDRQDQLDHPGGNASLESPRYKTDIALRIIRSR
jgi:hypothetical protein